MTKIIITAVMALVTFFSQAQVSEMRNRGNFSKIEVESGIQLIYSENDQVSIKVEAENETELNNIITELKGKTLKIYYAPENKTKMVGIIKVYINAHDVNSFKAVSNAKLAFKNSVKSEEALVEVASGASFIGTFAKNSKTTIKASSGATVCGRFDTDYLEGNFRSGATASLSGSAKKVNLSAKTGAFCTAKNLASEDVVVSATEFSNVQIYAVGKISVNAETGASITYFGKPKSMNLSTNSFARITDKKIKKMQIAME